MSELFERQPRLPAPDAPRWTMQLEPPPELKPSDGISSLLSSMMPMIGSIGSIVMVTMTNAGPAGIMSGGMFLLSSLGFVGVNGWRQRSKHTAEVLAARREYLAYLSKTREAVRHAANQQHMASRWLSPDPPALLYIADERTRVWERSVDDKDCLEIRYARSDQPLNLTIEAPDAPVGIPLDPVAASAVHRFVATHKIQRGLPLTLKLTDYSRIDISGNEIGRQALARAIVSQAATFHGPEILQVVVVPDQANMPNWEWAKWLPHAQSTRIRDAVGQARMIAPALSEIEDMLPEDVAERPRFKIGGRPSVPHILVVIDGGHVSPGSAVITDDGIQGVTVLTLLTAFDREQEPGHLRISVEELGEKEQQENPDSPKYRNAEVTKMGQSAVKLQVDQLSIVESEATARRLTPLYSGETIISAESKTELSAELTDLLGIGDIRDIDYSVTWRPRHLRDRLRVPIGLTTEGHPIHLDLKESAQQGMGPHGLLVGATGSGKSEVLRTLVLALAVTHSPEQLNFVLIDYKGGATFAGMADMPHVSAVITNLGEETTLVDRMQEALQGETVRRQELLRAAGNFSNVSDYEKARIGGRTDLAPLPALLIVADEFSELLTQKPDFAETFAAIGRVGRSLQVHLLMSSQRLDEGKLRGLDSHLSYRIGLRTFSAAESRTVLGNPSAYSLPSIPGMGILKTDDSSMTQFRAAYVSGPPKTRRRSPAERKATAEALIEPFTAGPVFRAVEPSTEPEVEEDLTEKRATFDIAIQRMRDLGPKAHRVWLPPLVTSTSFDQLMSDLTIDPRFGLVSPSWRNAGELTFPLGIVDRPLEQRRESYTISLAGASGHLGVAGAPRSGKSNGMRAALTALALTRSPLEAQFYIIDLGGGSFAPFKGLAHVAGIATRNEPEVMRRMVAEIAGIMNNRERFFRDHGIDSIETYRQRRALGQIDDGYGDIFLIIDGWQPFRTDYEPLENRVAEIAGMGLAFGIHLLYSTARWSDVRSAIREMSGTKIEFRLGASGDSEIDRFIAGKVPVNAPGRGLTMDSHHMMIAMPRIDNSGDPETLADGVTELIERINLAWTGPKPPKLRLLPEMITLDEVRQIAPPTENKLWLGIDEDNLAPWGFDHVSEPHLYLYGDANSGKSSMLRTFAHEVMRVYSPKEATFFVVDYRRALLGELPSEYVGEYLTTHDNTDSTFRDLFGLLKSRLPGPNVTPEELRNRTWWKGVEVFILVDDYDLVASSQGNPLSHLTPMLAQAADVGLHLTLTRRAGGASRASYDPAIQAFTDLGATGMLLSGNPDEGQLIGKVKPEMAIPGRAQIVSREDGIQGAQLAYTMPLH